MASYINFILLCAFFQHIKSDAVFYIFGFGSEMIGITKRLSGSAGTTLQNERGVQCCQLLGC